jgi:hypothetical protein
MKNSFTGSLGPGIYTNSFRALMPGLLIGTMFLAVAFASKSAADAEQQSIERLLTAKTVTPENLRQEISLHAGVTEGSPIRTNLIAVTETGLQKLNDPEQAAALERVTFEIDLPQSNDAPTSANKLPLELLELLSRRSPALQLELTLRVAPGNAGIAMLWFDAVRRSAEPGRIVDVSQIAVSLDKSMPVDKLKLDILRTKKMVVIKESQL